MQVEIALEYREKDNSPESLLCNRKEKIRVRIPEATDADAPIAFVIHNRNERPLQVRRYKNQLYKEARISFFNGKHTEEYPLENIPWGRVLHKYSLFGTCSSKAEYVACMKVAIRDYLIIDNVVYRRCNEPYYHIIRYGFGNCKTVIFTEFCDRSKKLIPGYSALDKDVAVKDAVRIANSNGISECVGDIEKMSQGFIEVLIPEACKRKFKRQIKTWEIFQK